LPVCRPVQGPVVGRGGGPTGQGPGSVVLMEAEVEQSAQVQAGEAVVQHPQIVLGDAAVADLAVAAPHQPGDGPFDHRPVLPVGPAGGFGLGVAAGGAQQLFVLMDLDRSAIAGGGALCLQRTVTPAGRFAKDRFTIDLPVATVRCPAGTTTAIRPAGSGGWMAYFGAACASCPLAVQCTSSRAGRTISIGPHEQQLSRARTA
jgi:hypothetical protein